jgi:hypothetical protein
VSPVATLQRRCACGGTPGPDGECAACRQKRLRGSAHGAKLGAAPEASRRVTRAPSSSGGSSGSSTDSRFGHDFSRVRVGTRSSATQSLVGIGETETVEPKAAPKMTDEVPAPARPATDELVCSVEGRWVEIPSSTLPATLTGSRLSASFNMIGRYWPQVIPCSCSCGEYRQYIRGEYKRNGATVVHRLCGTDISPTIFQEDCGRIGTSDYAYGYRSQRFVNSTFTRPDQNSGCRFEGADSPGITGTAGDNLEVNLDFKGYLIDTCNVTILATADWTVAGADTVP